MRSVRSRGTGGGHIAQLVVLALKLDQAALTVAQLLQERGGLRSAERTLLGVDLLDVLLVSALVVANVPVVVVAAVSTHGRLAVVAVVAATNGAKPSHRAQAVLELPHAKFSRSQALRVGLCLATQPVAAVTQRAHQQSPHLALRRRPRARRS